MQRIQSGKNWLSVGVATVLVGVGLVSSPVRAAAQTATIGVSVTVIRGEQATIGQASAQAELARAAATIQAGKNVKASNGITSAGVAQISRDTFVVANGREVPRTSAEAPNGKEVVRVTLEYAAN